MVSPPPAEQRPNCQYDLNNPKSGINYGKPKYGWRYDKEAMNRLIENKKIIWPANQDGRPRRKFFKSELKQEYTGFSSVIGDGIFTKDGTAEIESIFKKRVIE